MPDPVLIRGWKSARWHYALRLVAILTIGTAILFVRPSDKDAALLMEGSGWAILLANEVAASLNVRRRRWVTETDEGFTITDRRGDRAIHDDLVTDVLLKEHKKYSSGGLSSIRRTFSVWIRGEPRPIVMRNNIPASQPDPLADLIQRTICRLQQRWEDRLQQGERVSGAGWTLQSDSLTIVTRSKARSIPLQELTLAGCFDETLCVWREGEDQAVLRLSPMGRNARVVYAVLLEIVRRNQQIRGHCQESDVAAPDATPDRRPGNVGRMLFRRRSKPTRWVLGTVGLLLGVLAVTSSVNGDLPNGLVLGFLSLAAMAAFCRYPPGVLQCCEHGVRWGSFTGWKEIRFEELQSFACRTVRASFTILSPVTEIKLRFQSASQRIVFNATLHHEDSDMLWLRDHASRAVAARLSHEFEAGRIVRWTSHLAFRGTDLWYRPKTLLWKAKLQSLPLSRVRGYEIVQGIFYLYSTDSERSVLQEDVHEANFFPGLYLLRSLLPHLAPSNVTL